MKRAISAKNLWEATPKLVRQSIGRCLGLVPVSVLLGSKYRRAVRLVLESEGWSAQEALEYQLTSVQRIIALAYRRSAYYREAFEAVGFEPGDLRRLDDLAALPTIDKDTLRDNLERMRTLPVSHPSVDYISTSGTAGTPLFFYIGRERSSIEYAHLTISWRRVGYRPGMPMAVFRGRIVQQDRKGFHHEYDPIFRHHYFSSFHMSDENMQRYIDYIRQMGRCFLHVYPSAVAALARFIRRSNVTAPKNVIGIIAESEIVYPDQRRMVEGVFGCRYFSCYGHTEKLVLAAECEHSADYHVWPTYGYCELLDESGRPITTPGRRGEIVGTGFINTVVPFIRYRTGDYATYVGQRCSACGREQMILRDIRGHRTQEVLIAADGSEIPWAAMVMHDDTYIRVRQFQFYQDSPGKAVLRIVPAVGFDAEDRHRIIRNLSHKFAGRLTFTIELVEQIPLSPRGKAVYVDQRIAGHLASHDRA